MNFLRYSTASQEIQIGQFVSSTDGATAQTALSIANTDIKLFKEGATTQASKNSGGATHIANGYYYTVLDATDTGTLGMLEVTVNVSGALGVKRNFTVIPAMIYDSLILGTDRLDTNVTHVADTSQTAKDLGAINVTNLNTLSSHDPGATLGTSTLTQTQVTGGAYALNSASFAFNSGLDLTTTQKASVNTEADTALSDYGALKPTTAGRTLDVTATGEAGIDWANIGSPTTAVNLSGTTVKTATDVETDTQDIQSRLPAALTGGGNIKADVIALSGDTTAADNAEAFFDGTGYAGTNNVIPLVTTTTNLTNNGNIASGTIGSTGNSTTALHLAGLTYGDDEINDYLLVIRDVSESEYHARWIDDWAATGAIATVATLPFTPQNATDTYTILPVRRDALTAANVWAAATRTLTALDEDSTTLDLDTTIRSALGLVDNDLGTRLDTIDGNVDSILADTNELQTDWVNGGRLDLILDARASQTSVDTIDGIVDSILVDTAEIGVAGAGLTAIPWNASWDAEVQSEVQDAIEANNLDHLVKSAVDTDFATTVHLNSVIGHIADNGTTATFDRTTDSLEALQAEHDVTQGKVDAVDDFVDTEVAAIKTVVDAIKLSTDNLPSDPADASVIAGLISGLDTKLDTIDNFVDTEVAAIKTVTDKVDTALVLDGAVYQFTANALELAPTGGSAPTAADIADAVWEEDLTDHSSTVGSVAEALGAAGSAGDPWATALPGAYGSGSAGKIIGDNINATISSRASQTSVDDVPTNAELATALGTADDATLSAISSVDAKIDIIDTNVDSVKAKTDSLTFTTANRVDSTAITVSDKTGYSLSSAGIQAIWDALTSALTTVGSVGKWIVDKLDVVVSTRASQTSLDTLDDYVDTEVAAIKAKTDNLPASPANESTLTTIAGYIDTEVAAIKAKTDNLPTDPADASDIAASFSTVNSTLATIAGYIDTEVAAIKAKTDNLPSDPADASDIASAFSTVNTKLDTIDDFLDTEVAAIKAKTDSLTFTVAGQVDSNVQYVNDTQVAGTGESGDEWGPV